MQTEMARTSSRRDRVRAATTAEILQTARKLLLTEGSGAISLRAIAREMGMTAPAIYRYFPSHEELLRHVVASLFDDLTDCIQGAAAAAARDPGLAGAEPGFGVAMQLIAACRAFRDWALEHRAEFGLIFASPLPALNPENLPVEDVAMVCGMRFGQTFFDLFSELYLSRPFPVPADDEIDPAMFAQLARLRDLPPATPLFSEFASSGLPLGAMLVFLRAWVTLYGSISLEAFNQIQFALTDGEPMFELVMAELGAMVGINLPAR